MAKKMMKISKDACCCPGACEVHPHGRGKALLNIAIGVLLIAFGFGIYIKSIETLALLVGVLYLLKGGIKMKNTC